MGVEKLEVGGGGGEGQRDRCRLAVCVEWGVQWGMRVLLSHTSAVMVGHLADSTAVWLGSSSSVVCGDGLLWNPWREGDHIILQFSGSFVCTVGRVVRGVFGLVPPRSVVYVGRRSSLSGKP